MTIKSKGLVISAMVPLLSAGLIVGIASANNNNNFGITAVQAEKLAERDEGAAIAGNALYVNLSAVSDWWFKDGFTTHAYFFHDAVQDVIGTESAWVTGFTAVPNDSNVYEVAVPSGYTEGHPWTNVIICRATASNWDNVAGEGQTGNMVVNSNGQNGVTIQNSTWTDEGDHNKVKRSASSFSYAAETRILKWINASGNGSWTNSGVCDDGGDTVQATLESAWSASKTEYNAIKGADVKAYFSNIAAVKDSLNDVEDIAARYDHILSAHPTWNLDNFASR